MKKKKKKKKRTNLLILDNYYSSSIPTPYNLKYYIIITPEEASHCPEVSTTPLRASMHSQPKFKHQMNQIKLLPLKHFHYKHTNSINFYLFFPVCSNCYDDQYQSLKRTSSKQHPSPNALFQ